MLVKTKTGRVIELPSDEEDAIINAGIAADPDTYELSDKEFKQLKPVGRPKSAVTKDKITIRLSHDVTDYFRSTGKGWQTRINRVLQNYVKTHSGKSDKEKGDTTDATL